MSGNPGSVPPPVPLLVSLPASPPVAPSIISPVQLTQNPQVYVKEISINKSSILIEAINKARK